MKNSSHFMVFLILLVIIIGIAQVAGSEFNEKKYERIGLNNVITEKTFSKNLMLQADDDVDEAEGMRRNLQTGYAPHSRSHIVNWFNALVIFPQSAGR
jgi:hypothetical protein